MYEETLKELSELVLEPLQNCNLFTDEDVYNPETGEKILSAQSAEVINNGLGYLYHTNRVLENFYNCLRETVFIEELVSAENLPVFASKENFILNLKLNYQLWLIKLSSCYDCILQCLNSVYELGLIQKAVNVLSVAQNEKILTVEKLAVDLNKLDKLFAKASNYEVPEEMKKPNLKNHRNKIIHYNELSRRDFYAGQVMAEIANFNDWTINFEFQGIIGKLSNDLINEIREINIEAFPLMVSLFRTMYEEYKIRLCKKLGLE